MCRQDKGGTCLIPTHTHPPPTRHTTHKMQKISNKNMVYHLEYITLTRPVPTPSHTHSNPPTHSHTYTHTGDESTRTNNVHNYFLSQTSASLNYVASSTGVPQARCPPFASQVKGADGERGSERGCSELIKKLA